MAMIQKLKHREYGTLISGQVIGQWNHPENGAKFWIHENNNNVVILPNSSYELYEEERKQWVPWPHHANYYQMNFLVTPDGMVMNGPFRVKLDNVEILIKEEPKP